MRTGERLALLLTTCAALVSCSGSNGGQRPSDSTPIDIDYSELRVAEASETLRVPQNEEELLRALRNGLRLSVDQSEHVFAFAPTEASQNTDAAASYSRTTQQVDGVDEADLVKYDGTHLFVVRPEPIATSSIAPYLPTTRNVLSIFRTDAAAATAQLLSQFTLEGEQSDSPLIYALDNESGTAELLAAVSHDARFWGVIEARTSTLPASIVVSQDTSRIQLLDVHDPYNVRQTWKLEIDGWLRASRKIGDVLYVVTSFHPRLLDLALDANTTAQREENEGRIRAARADELLPGYRIDDRAAQPLVRATDCVVGSNLQSFHAYDHLLVITAIDLRERRITDSTCVNTNASGVYVSQSSLYIGGERSRNDGPGVATVLHKFALANGAISYAGSGAVDGQLGWTNPSYYMDERDDELRILTSQWSGAIPEHRLSILRQMDDELRLVATLPNSGRPAAIGKPGEVVRSVRFVADRAYVVTAQMIDPFYVIDLSDSSDPFIVGELELPGFSTYLHPLGPSLVASIGQHTSDEGRLRGVKVELFDVSNPDTPRSVGAQIFGDSGSRSEAIQNPHAVAFLSTQDDAYRMALPIDVFETANPNSQGVFDWTYTGLHVLEVQNASTGSPRLNYQGVIRTNEPSTGATYPPYITPQRGVLHGDSVFAISGDEVIGRAWQDLTRPPSTGMQF